MERELAWFPFTSSEIEIALGVCGLGATAATLLGVPGPWVVVGTVGSLSAFFSAGLLVRAAGNRVARVDLDGALHGRGYTRVFQQVQRSLLLIHLDDDAPNEELLGLYRSLLSRGVEIRRLIFVRPDHQADGIRWIEKFGPHEHLRQRVVESDSGSTLMLSFAVVDDRVVLLAIPGFHKTETAPFATACFLRHLVELRHPGVTRAFLEVYESAWRRARSVDLELEPTS